MLSASHASKEANCCLNSELTVPIQNVLLRIGYSISDLGQSTKVKNVSNQKYLKIRSVSHQGKINQI